MQLHHQVHITLRNNIFVQRAMFFSTYFDQIYAEPCEEASVPEPSQFVDSSENGVSVHLNRWQDANCPTSYFTVERR